MKILVPIILFLIATACASKPKMTYCDLVTEEPTESYSAKSSKAKRGTANAKTSKSKR